MKNNFLEQLEQSARKYWKKKGLCLGCGRKRDNPKYKTCNKCRQLKKYYKERDDAQ